MYIWLYIYTNTSDTAGAKPKILFYCFKPSSATHACTVHRFLKVPSYCFKPSSATLACTEHTFSKVL